jgi:putative oxidoreductase
MGMTISRCLANPMLASIFITGGLDAIRNPESKAKSAEAVTVPLARRLPWLPQDTETLVRVNGMVQVGAGVLLAAGKFRRLAALALIGSIIPTTYAGHRFWEEVDDVTRAQQRTHLLKNVGLLGGLVLAAVDTDGAPSMSWRAKRNARRLSAALAIGRTAGATRATAGATRATTGATKAKTRGTRALRAGIVASEIAAHGAAEAAARGAGHANEVASHLARQGVDAAGPYVSGGVDRADHLLSKVADQLAG